ncbi:MAG: ATP-binding protein [Chloroflexaceae bacterium]
MTLAYFEQLQETVEQQPAELPTAHSALVSEDQRCREGQRRLSERVAYLESQLRRQDRLLARAYNARSKAEHIREQQAFLAEVSRVLACSLDYNDTLEQVARLIVPYLADWCVIDLVADAGEIERVAAAHRYPEQERHLHDLHCHYPVDPNLPHPVLKVIETGWPEVMSDLSDTVLEVYTRDAAHQQLVRELGTRSAIVVPLLVRGNVLGTLTLVSSRVDHYQSRDLPLIEDLAYRIAMSVDNARLYRQTQTAIRERDQFLSVVAHELKTPLTSMLGYSRLLAHRADPASPLTEREQRALQVIATQTNCFKELIETLLDLSRLQMGHLRIQQVPLELGSLVNQVVEELQATSTDTLLIYQPAPESLFVAGDAVALRQVVRNLLQNAIKYSRPGDRVEVCVEQRAAQVGVRITDQGIGIPAVALPHLFQSFYRAPNAVQHQQHGIGVGLYIVKELVTLHGGSIDVTSQEGVGSSFTVTLPLAAEPRATRSVGEVAAPVGSRQL